jgi:hypothetical protein
VDQELISLLRQTSLFESLEEKHLLELFRSQARRLAFYRGVMV